MTNPRDIAVSAHGLRRVRKRLGLSRQAALRRVRKAYLDGLDYTAFTGVFRAYLNTIVHDSRPSDVIRIHGGALFLFENQILVTAWVLPPEYRTLVARAEGGRR